MAPLPLSAPTHPPPTTSQQPNDHSSEPPSKKRKKTTPSTVHTATLRATTWTYFHLHLTTTTPPPSSPLTSDLDPLTIKSLLTPPLQSYLGLTGAAIPIDILKSEGRSVWIRVQRRDAKGVQAALASWAGGVEGGLVPGVGREEEGKRVRVSWRVVESRGTLGKSAGGRTGDGGDLFAG